MRRVLRISPHHEKREHGIRGIIRDRVFVGQATKYIVAAGNLDVGAQLNSSSRAQTFAPGDHVWLDWSEQDSIVLNATAP